MKITKIEPILFDADLGRVWLFIRVLTDSGVEGIGESTTTEPFMAAAVVKSVAATLIGADPARIQEIWQQTYRRYFNVRGGPLLLCAMSGIEHALWDIKGKVAGLSVCDLLGGRVRERIPVYANHMFFAGVHDAAGYADRAAEAVARGYRTIKIDPFDELRDSISPADLRSKMGIVRAIRDAVGPDIQIGIDTHSKFSMSAAIRIGRALEEFDPFFLEEPVPPENIEALKKVRDSINVPIATGERIYTKWGFQALVQSQAAEILQVDVAHCGGILEARFIAAIAEAHYVQIAPHSWYGPISLAASLHLDATVPNFLIQETAVPHRLPDRQRDLLVDQMEMVDGHLEIPDGPGLGVAFNDDILRRYQIAL